MTRHENFNIPKINKTKTLAKILLVLSVPIIIIVSPLFYGQEIRLENVLTAIVSLFGLAYIVFFIMGK